ncbi:MAG: hypothetical protein ACRDPC_03860 [Solirubrobacteraceae bacterium]
MTERAGGGAAWPSSSALAGGCGGGDEPSAAERKAELKRWAQRADAICRDAEQSIVAHGEAVDLRDLDAVAVRASADVTAAIDAIRRLRVPEGARPKVRPVLRELDRVESMLEQLTRATEAIDVPELSRLASEFLTLKHVQEKARAAGIDECMRGAAGGVVSQAIVAPIFATQVSAFEQWLVRALTRLDPARPRTPDQLAYYDRLNDLATRARQRWDKLKPPDRAEYEAENYGRALADFRELTADVAAEVERGREITPSWARTVRKRFRRVGGSERRAMRNLLEMVGARPIPVDPAEPETEEQQS